MGWGKGILGGLFWVCFLELYLVKTARNAARFSIWLFGLWFGAVDWLFGKVLSVLGLSFTKFGGIKLSPLTRCVLGVWFRVCCSTKCCSFLSPVFFSGCRVWFFRGCVKVLSVLGWLFMGPIWVTQTSWFGFSSVCYNSTKYCRFTERPCFMGTRFLGLVFFSDSWFGFCFGSFPLFLSLSLSFFLFLLSLSLFLSRGLTCRHRPLALL